MIPFLLLPPSLFACYYLFGEVTSAYFFFFVSLLGAFIYKFKNKKSITSAYLLVAVLSVFSFFSDSIKPLQATPLLFSIFFLLIFVISEVNGISIPLESTKKFTKLELSETDINFLVKSHKWWIVVLLINVVLHIFFLLNMNFKTWTLYASFGWYFIFFIALIANIAIGKLVVKK